MTEENETLYYSTEILSWKSHCPTSHVTNIELPLVHGAKYGNFVTRFFSRDPLFDNFVFLKSNNLPCNISISPNGENLIILKNNYLEIHNKKSAINEKIIKIDIKRDSFPQWTNITWSNKSNYGGVSFSSGNCLIFALDGSKYLISSKKTIEKSNDVIIKITIRESDNGLVKVCLLTLNKKIVVIDLVNLKPKRRVKSYLDFLSTPILSCQVNELGNLLVLGTYSNSYHANSDKALQSGIVLCRFIDDEPYINPVVTFDLYSTKNIFSNIMYSRKSDGIYCMKLLSDNSKLATLSISGILSIWSFPSLKCLFILNKTVFNISNEMLSNDFIKGKLFPPNYNSYAVTDICWWGLDFLAINLINGQIVLLSMDQSIKVDKVELSNPPFTKIEACNEKSFYTMSCITKSQNTEYVDNLKSDYLSWNPLSIAKQIVSFFYKIDIEPKQINNTLCIQYYKLSCLTLTNSEELYKIKIKEKKYGEALQLAERYNLDYDIIYQNQWRDSNMTLDDIKNILVKISKRNWILNECLERIPANLESVKNLINLGLQLTTFADIEGCSLHDDSMPNDFEFLINSEFRQVIDEIAFNKIVLSEFNILQLELIRIRLKLLCYLDKSSLYEEILKVQRKTFDCAIFSNIKMLSPFELAVNYAQTGDLVVLKIILCHYNSELHDHILVIISNIPECVDPNGYSHLFSGALQGPIEEFDIKLKIDWCENDKFADICNRISFSEDSINLYYTNNPETIWMRQKSIGTDTLVDWFEWRIRETEKWTLKSDNSKALINICENLGIEIDAKLRFNITFLFDAIYNCQVNKPFLCLEELEDMSDLSKAKLIISNAKLGLFVNHFSHWILPLFVDVSKSSIESTNTLFKDFMNYIANDHLDHLKSILEDKTVTNLLLDILGIQPVLKVYLDIISIDDNCKNVNECSNILFLLNELVDNLNSTKEFIATKNRIQDLEKIISVIKMLEKYCAGKSIKFINGNRMNSEAIEHFLTNMFCLYLKSLKSLSKSDIKSLLSDAEVCVSLVFKCIHPKLLYKKMVRVLLESGDPMKIDTVSYFVTLNRRPVLVTDMSAKDRLLDFEETCDCVVTAARSYIDTSVTSRDLNMQHALYCLNLLQEHTVISEQELELIKCCEILEEFRCPVIPVELRGVIDRTSFLKNSLDKNADLYRNPKKVAQSGVYLCDTTIKDRKYRKCEALRILTVKALEKRYVDIADEVIQQLIESNHKPAWKECILILKFPDFPLDKKYEIGKFAISYCPDSELMSTISIINNIQLATFNCMDSNTDVEQQTGSNTNSNIISHPIKLLSSGLIDLSSKMSWRSIIDRSSDSLVKLTNQVTQLALKENKELYVNRRGMLLTEMRCHLLYDKSGELESLNSLTEVETLLKALQLSSTIDNPESQRNREKIHLKLVLYNLQHDTMLALLHGMFVENVSLLYQLKDELESNKFSKAIIYMLLGFNLIYKYNGKVEVSQIIHEGLDSYLNNIRQSVSSIENKLLDNAKRDLSDYTLLDEISLMYPNLDHKMFFSSVDYRKNIIIEMSKFTNNHKLFRIINEAAIRYNVDKYTINWYYTRTFIERFCDKPDLQIYNDVFLTNVSSDIFVNGQETFQIDIERLIRDQTTNQTKRFIFILDVVKDLNKEAKLFEKSVTTHLVLLELFDWIFVGTESCMYLDLVTGNHSKVLNVLHSVISQENIDSCEELLQQFDLINEFTKIKTQFSSVIASQIMWSNSSVPEQLPSNQLLDRFDKSLSSFGSGDFSNFQEYIYTTLFQKSKQGYISPESKLSILKGAQKFINHQINDSKVAQDIINGWSKVSFEVDVWKNHIEECLITVVKQIKALDNVSNDVKLAIEYLSPDNYWEYMLNEMLLGSVSIQNIFTIVWELNIDFMVVENVLITHLSRLCSSKFMTIEKIEISVLELLTEVDEYFEYSNVESVLLGLLTADCLKEKMELRVQLLKEYRYRCQQAKVKVDPRVRSVLIDIMRGWSVPVQNSLELSAKTVVSLADALIQDCETPTQMLRVSCVIELMEVACEDNVLWQCWVKTCVIRGTDFTQLIFGRFQQLKAEKCYQGRFDKIIVEAVQALTAFNPAEAISLLILVDPIKSNESIQIILLNVRSDPQEFANTMKRIDPRALAIIVNLKLVPIYAKTILFQRLVNYITKEHNNPADVQLIMDQLKQNNLHDEATWLASSSSQINPAMKTIEMVSGFWKKFSGSGGAS